MNASKKDTIAITALSIIFFLVATWNLGVTQIPVKATEVSPGLSFWVNLGEPKDVESVFVLIEDGFYNLTISVGSPENWKVAASSHTFMDYYKWDRIDIQQTTDFLKFDFGHSSSNATIEEIAFLNEDNIQIPVTPGKIVALDNTELAGLLDEQDKVNLPPTYMVETYFDEIYFVKTAKQYQSLQLPYEWVHPPLGKLILSTGISVFGFNPFGWRIFGVVFATFMIPIIYFIGKTLFENWIGAFAGAFLLAFDFMHFTMARMGTVDTYLVFFSLLSQLAFVLYFKNVLKDGWKSSTSTLFLATLFFALAFSTKWIALYGFAGMVFLLLVLRLKEVFGVEHEGFSRKVSVLIAKPFFSLLLALSVAIFVYFLTYVPDMLAGRTIADVFELQQGMLNYHATLTATHPFSSQWWSWPLMVKPLWLYVSYMPDAFKSTIVLLGNPVVWWVGFTSIVFATGKVIRKKDFATEFLVVVFFFQWVPYVFISRATFIYHFYLNVPLLCLAIAYFINKCWDKKWGKVATLFLLLSVVLMFGLFYPVVSGIPVSTEWIDKLRWFNTWYF